MKKTSPARNICNSHIYVIERIERDVMRHRALPFCFVAQPYCTMHDTVPLLISNKPTKQAEKQHKKLKLFFILYLYIDLYLLSCGKKNVFAI